jgi:TorA maturation chaperone TorD
MTPEIRYFFYDLFFSMFVREPADEIIEAWRRGLEAVYQARFDESLAEGAGKLLEILAGEAAGEAVRAEFVRLFWLPEGSVVSLLGSQYVDGKPFGGYLVRVRTFLEEIPFRKCDDYAEPEDSLPFHLDLMRRLIQEESEAADPGEKAAWGALQDEFANGLMGGWIDRLLAELAVQEVAPFYQQVAFLLRLYLQREHEFLLERRGKGE